MRSIHAETTARSASHSSGGVSVVAVVILEIEDAVLVRPREIGVTVVDEADAIGANDGMVPERHAVVIQKPLRDIDRGKVGADEHKPYLKLGQQRAMNPACQRPAFLVVIDVFLLHFPVLALQAARVDADHGESGEMPRPVTGRATLPVGPCR